ncbi:MAG: hypothetical protein ABUS79_15370 [Pseudomonadota bacterium]
MNGARPGLRRAWLGLGLGLALLPTGGCRGKAAPTPPSPSVTAAGVPPPAAPPPSPTVDLDDPHLAARLPEPCEAYRRKLLLCMENDHFPKDAKESQRLALAQMLAIVVQERREGAAAAEANCRDSIETMKESGKTSCPGVF